jgi:hypothetical protein
MYKWCIKLQSKVITKTIEIPEVRVGQLIKVNGYGFVFGIPNNTVIPVCYNVEQIK